MQIRQLIAQEGDNSKNVDNSRDSLQDMPVSNTPSSTRRNLTNRGSCRTTFSSDNPKSSQQSGDTDVRATLQCETDCATISSPIPFPENKLVCLRGSRCSSHAQVADGLSKYSLHGWPE